MSKNLLRELPESFGSLTNLRRLDLYGNQLTHLPLSFCHLKALRWLDLKNNPLVPTLADIAGPCGDTQQCAGLAKLSNNVTDQLLTISRNLADTTQRSAETLETLANSSTSVHSTRDELMTTSSVIQQSGTLLAKYGRRELTDKVLLFFAFAFFFACVLYIVHKVQGSRLDFQQTALRDCFKYTSV